MNPRTETFRMLSALPLMSRLYAARPCASAADAAALEDSALIEELLRTGSQDLFGVLATRYQDKVFRLVASILGPGHDADAEDVTQEVFLLVHHKLSGFRRRSRFRTWLYRVATNRALDRKRLARFSRPHLGEEALESAVTRGAGEDPFAEASRRQGDRALREAVQELAEPFRTVVYLHYWMECPVAEIAEVLGTRPGTVKSNLFRAREKLARLLRED